VKPGGARFDLYVGFRSRLPTSKVYCNQFFVGGFIPPVRATAKMKISGRGGFSLPGWATKVAPTQA
jgi:hypothetical protein